MYADNTLTPKEAARLCALGTLADGPLTYEELARSVRHFLDRLQGPILDVMGSSIELLKYMLCFLKACIVRFGQALRHTP